MRHAESKRGASSGWERCMRHVNRAGVRCAHTVNNPARRVRVRSPEQEARKEGSLLVYITATAITGLSKAER
jgi:hypothetical protein